MIFGELIDVKSILIFGFVKQSFTYLSIGRFDNRVTSINLIKSQDI
jgi:hypothetical protein